MGEEDEGDRHRRSRGELVGEVWAVLERAGRPLSAAEVQQSLPRSLAYSTVITTLGRLHAKGLLVRERHGRSHRYAPVTDEAGLAAREMQRVLHDHVDRGDVLSRFVSDLSADDEAVLRRLLAEHPEGSAGLPVAAASTGATPWRGSPAGRPTRAGRPRWPRPA